MSQDTTKGRRIVYAKTACVPSIARPRTIPQWIKTVNTHTANPLAASQLTLVQRTPSPAWIRLAFGLVLVSIAGTGCVATPNINSGRLGINQLQGVRPEESLPPDAAENLLDTAAARPQYRIGPGDEIVVIVWGRPDLGSQVPTGQRGELRSSTVTDEGTIFMPFLGGVKVSGKTLEEARTILSARYGEIIENPQLEVTIRSCESQVVFVGGAVQKTGTQYLCTTRVTVGDVLTQAGGLTGEANSTRGLLTRNFKTYHIDYRMSEMGESPALKIPLQDGDTLFFPEKDERFVYIFGEVNRQGLYPIPDHGLTLLEALSRAHGLDTRSASIKSLFLIREQNESFLAYKMTFAELLQHPEVQLGNRDRIFVPASGLTRWERFWRKVIPFTTIRTTIDTSTLVGE